MFLKIFFFLNSHLDVFPTYLSDVGDGNGEYTCIYAGEVIPGQVEQQHVG